jgi:hypothetical protein
MFCFSDLHETCERISHGHIYGIMLSLRTQALMLNHCPQPWLSMLASQNGI